MRAREAQRRARRTRQFCFPSEKGMNASRISLVGLSHRDGRNESGDAKISGFRKRSRKWLMQREPAGTSSFRLVRTLPPATRMERPTGCRRRPSLITRARCSDRIQVALDISRRDALSFVCSSGLRASSSNMNAMLAREQNGHTLNEHGTLIRAETCAQQNLTCKPWCRVLQWTSQ